MRSHETLHGIDRRYYRTGVIGYTVGKLSSLLMDRLTETAQQRIPAEKKQEMLLTVRERPPIPSTGCVRILGPVQEFSDNDVIEIYDWEKDDELSTPKLRIVDSA